MAGTFLDHECRHGTLISSGCDRLLPTLWAMEVLVSYSDLASSTAPGALVARHRNLSALSPATSAAPIYLTSQTPSDKTGITVSH